MAETPQTKLVFQGRCPDCGQRQVSLPAALPALGDDFEWRARDFDSIRQFMLEELAARFPERERWTAADLEVVIVEVLATMLDQISDMADRVAAEAYLETARRPESVRRLLQFIGYNAVQLARLQDDAETKLNRHTAEEKLEKLWLEDPLLMERARRNGPLNVHTQQRMVTTRDYTSRLEEHPIVMRAAARSHWSGSWVTLQVAVILPWVNTLLDDPVSFDENVKSLITEFHEQRGVPVPEWETEPLPTYRMILRLFIDAYRMIGQEVILEDARPVGIIMNLSIKISAGYFQSEVRRAVEAVLGTESDGFFAPGRLRFGEDLHASDLFQVLMNLDGVENVCLNRFKKVGNQFTDQSLSGIIRLDGLEIAVCDNDPANPRRGFYHLTLHGGRKG